MRRFTSLCKDNITGMYMVLSECSYNTACSWLEENGFTEYDKFEVIGNQYELTFSKPTNKVFVYDDNRGYLLSN